MPRGPRQSRPTALVLVAMLRRPAAWQHGYALMQATGLAAGTLYPVLLRLADYGWLEERWEQPTGGSPPPRHLYRVAPGARAAARAVLDAWVANGMRLRTRVAGA